MEKENKSKYYMSYISYRLSSLTGDYITVAQIFIKNDDVSIIISENKMKLLKKIVPKELYNFFKRNLESYKKYEKELTYSKIDRDYRYFNGMMKIHRPSCMALDSIEDLNQFVNTHFNKFVDDYFVGFNKKK